MQRLGLHGWSPDAKGRNRAGGSRIASRKAKKVEPVGLNVSHPLQVLAVLGFQGMQICCHVSAVEHIGVGREYKARAVGGGSQKLNKRGRSESLSTSFFS